LGVAVQSKFPGVGGLVPYGAAEVGVVATQAFGNPRHGSVGLELIRQGATPSQVVEILLQSDDLRRQRQFGVLDGKGRAASHTGEDVYGWGGWAGVREGDNCLVLGNGLTAGSVAENMVEQFEHTKGTLAERLIATLQAGEEAGGEQRGQQSAALSVFREGGGYGGLDDRHVTISIYDHRQPIDELARCFEIHKLSYFSSDPQKLVKIEPGLAEELKLLMIQRGFFTGPPDSTWGPDEIAAMQRFMGWENYDNRIRDDDLIDREVLADMRLRRDHLGGGPQSTA
jgi:uncharacterized Ntn-hydrolase superfamily protein